MSGGSVRTPSPLGQPLKSPGDEQRATAVTAVQFLAAIVRRGRGNPTMRAPLSTARLTEPWHAPPRQFLHDVTPRLYVAETG